MNILYDSQIFQMQKFGGISRYFYWLCKFNGGLYNYDVSGKYTDNIYAREISAMSSFPLKARFRGKGRILKLANTLSDRMAVRSLEYDVYHPTYYFVPEFQAADKPLVITVHDFIHELFPKYFSADKTTVPAKKKSLHNADRIIAISENTKKDLRRFYPDIDERRIDVVYHAIDWKAGEKHELPFNIEKPYILFTGQRGAYKNFSSFMRACAGILENNDLELVCTGTPFSKAETDLLASLAIAGRVRNVFADDDGLKALYEHALCFVFPSLYEGFGFPILEAFASGCPAILSAASCFPEIAGRAALYFDPNSESDMKEKIALAVQSGGLRQDLAQKGFERYKDFAMDNMVRGTFSAYQKAGDMTVVFSGGG